MLIAAVAFYTYAWVTSSVPASRIGQRVFFSEACKVSCNPKSAAKGHDVEDPATQHHHTKPQCVLSTQTLHVVDPDSKLLKAQVFIL